MYGSYMVLLIWRSFHGSDVVEIFSSETDIKHPSKSIQHCDVKCANWGLRKLLYAISPFVIFSVLQKNRSGVEVIKAPFVNFSVTGSFYLSKT